MPSPFDSLIQTNAANQQRPGGINPANPGAPAGQGQQRQNSWWDYITGTPSELQTYYNLTPQQQTAQDTLLSGGIQQQPLYQQGSNYLSQLLDGSSQAYQNFEAPYLRQFNESIVPDLAARFGNLGTGGSAMRGNNFGHALGGAAQRLSEGLASMRSGLQSNAAQQALGYAQQPYNNMQAGLQRNNYTPYLQQGIEGLLPQFAQGAGRGAGSSLMALLGLA